MRESLIAYLEEHMLTCSFKEMTGWDCLGCGAQRSAVLLLKGEMWLSIQLFPPLIPMLSFILFALVHLIFGLKRGAKILQIHAVTIALLMFGNYLFKLI